MVNEPNPILYDANGIMTWENQAQFMLYWHGTWAKERGGYAKVVASPRHLWEEVYVADEKPRILICCLGEIGRPENASNFSRRVDRQWMLAIIRGHNGFKNLVAEGQGQPNTPGAVDPFLKNCQVIRDRQRMLINITEEPQLDGYKSMDPLPSLAPYGPTGNVFLDGYGIKTATANDIPAIIEIDPG